MARKLQSMTCAQLIEALQDFDGATPVVFAYTYPDHWRTTLAGTVAEADEGNVAWSEYHAGFKDATDEAEEAADPDEDDPTGESAALAGYTKVVVLRSVLR
jgi:hypothetical protein